MPPGKIHARPHRGISLLQPAQASLHACDRALEHHRIVLARIQPVPPRLYDVLHVAAHAGNIRFVEDLVDIHRITKRGGGLLPLGGATEKYGSHKGYGYGMIAEIFTSILSMGLTSNYCMVGSKAGVCHGFVAIDPACFGDAEAIKKHFSTYLDEIRNSPKAEGHDRIYIHGEKEMEAYKDRMENGIPVNENTLIEALDVCEYLGMDFSSYFGDYMPSEEMRKKFKSIW